MTKIILIVIEFIQLLYFTQINFHSFYILFILSLFAVVLQNEYQITFIHGRLYSYEYMWLITS